MSLQNDFVQLSRLALIGNREEVALLVRRVLPKLSEATADQLTEINNLLAQSPSGLGRSKPQKQAAPLPIDLDSRLELLRQEDYPVMPVKPTWPPHINKELNQFIAERRRAAELVESGIMPTRSLLLVGPPGVGKSLAARHLAIELQRPLLTLDLAAVMSSFLGRTGSNIRAVLDYARSIHSVLLLDEFDAIAKRRDDSAEVGELKRLVTVLLQAIDDWPSEGVLLATTNHPDLLDPAVWRRFERVIEFPYPSMEDISLAIASTLEQEKDAITTETIDVLASLFEGQSFADVRKAIISARRESFITQLPLKEVLAGLVPALLSKKSHSEKVDVAVSLLGLGWPERQINQVTGIARDTFRKKSVRVQERRSRSNGKKT
ncbi:MAG: ATP-binding protein [Pyrinomonadaceae bacterium]